jgi:hypothetical protein
MTTGEGASRSGAELQALVEGAGFSGVEVRRGADAFNGAPQHSNAAVFGTVGAGITGRKP